MNKPALTINSLRVCYQNQPVLWDINLIIPQGILGALIGPNGAGKTTLIKAVLGLVKPTTGSILFFGEPYSKEILRTIAYVPQSTAIDWELPFTVYDIALMGTYGSLGWFKRPGKEQEDITLNALDAVGMLPLFQEPIRNLSGGQRQRLLLARALAQQAKLYILDEPFNGVDQLTEQTIIIVLKKLRDNGATIIAVHHDLTTASHYFEWAALLNHTVFAQGPITEVIAPTFLGAAYGKPVITQNFR